MSKVKIKFTILCYALLTACAEVVNATNYYKVTHEVFFDITQEGESLGRIVIGLFGEDVPKTVRNFRTIATKGINGLTYAGSKFHRIIPRFIIQGGDIVSNNGSGSISIYGDHFPDENFKINHSGPGLVSMANFGKDLNGCQFFITTLETPALNGRYVAFGKVVDGQSIVHAIEHTKRNFYTEQPIKPIIISACGELEVRKPYFVPDHPYTLWAYFKAIAPPLTLSLTILGIFQWIMNRLNVGCI